MSWWENLKQKIKIKMAGAQQEHASKIDDDFLDSSRDAATMVLAKGINELFPKQSDNTVIRDIYDVGINAMMPDYGGNLDMSTVLSSKDNSFLAQPLFSKQWSEAKRFDLVKPEENKLKVEDVKGKYILTYYPTFATSWLGRTTDNMDDTTNKNFYSHCKSSLYKEDGTPLHTINPHPWYNDKDFDATVYVPEDSFSYVINYEDLGLKREDIEDAFAYASEGINVMDPTVQDAIFRLNASNISRDEIIALWKDDVIITDSSNILELENRGDLKLSDLNLAKNPKGNKLHYNLQDYSCAIQPLSPILYATSVKIKRDGLDEKQADVFRKEIGLFNIHDVENYKEINSFFYESARNNVKKELKQDIKETYNSFIENPLEMVKDIGSNLYHTQMAIAIKTVRDTSDVLDIFGEKVSEKFDNKVKKRVVAKKSMELQERYKNDKAGQVTDNDVKTSMVNRDISVADMER